MNLKRKLQAFCIECGKESNELIEGLCFDCYQKKKPIEFPRKIKILKCTICNKVFFQGKTFPESSELIEKIIKSQIKLRNCKIKKINSSFNEQKSKVFLELVLSLNENEFSIEKELPLSISRTACNSCSRIAGGYFEAIIQLRLKKHDLENAKKMLKSLFNEMSKVEPMAVIIRESRLPQGYDFIIASRKAAKKAVNALRDKFNAKLSIASKQAGIKEGKQLKRMVYCLKN